MADFFFNSDNLTLTKSTDTVVTSVEGTDVTFEASKDVKVSLPESAISNLGLKKDSKVTIDKIGNGFLIKATPTKKPASSTTRGSSPAGVLNLSND